MKCSKCLFENPSDSRFCGSCGFDLSVSEKTPFSATRTFQVSLKELAQGTLYAGRYEVIEELVLAAVKRGPIPARVESEGGRGFL